MKTKAIIMLSIFVVVVLITSIDKVVAQTVRFNSDNFSNTELSKIAESLIGRELVFSGFSWSYPAPNSKDPDLRAEGVTIRMHIVDASIVWHDLATANVKLTAKEVTLEGGELYVDGGSPECGEGEIGGPGYLATYYLVPWQSSNATLQLDFEAYGDSVKGCYIESEQYIRFSDFRPQGS